MKQALVALAIFAGMGIAVNHATADASTPKPIWMTTPCQYEDSSNCYWDAGKAGDRAGHSFYSIRVGDKDCIAYWENRYAKHHNYCI